MATLRHCLPYMTGSCIHGIFMWSPKQRYAPWPWNWLWPQKAPFSAVSFTDLTKRLLCGFFSWIVALPGSFPLSPLNSVLDLDWLIHGIFHPKWNRQGFHPSSASVTNLFLKVLAHGHSFLQLGQAPRWKKPHKSLQYGVPSVICSFGVLFC